MTTTDFVLDRLKAAIPNVPIHLLSEEEIRQKFNLHIVEELGEIDLFNYQTEVANEDIEINISTPRSQDAPKEKELNGIQDFGEKIGGARKDMYALRYRDYTSKVLEGDYLELRNKTLNELLPPINLKNLKEDNPNLPEAIIPLIQTLYMTISTKPRVSNYKMSMWVDEVKQLAENLQEILSNIDNPNMLDKIIDQHINGTWGRNITNIMIWNTLRSIYDKDPEANPNINLIKGLKGYWSPDSKQYILINKKGKQNNRRFSDSDLVRITTDFVENNFEDLVPKKGSNTKVKKDIKFEIYSSHSEGVFIGVRKYQDVFRIKKGFENSVVAREFLKDDKNVEELTSIYEALTSDIIERNDTNEERKGSVYRNDDVTPELYQEVFGFRAVEFGNYLNNKERQAVLNESYDAFMDLSNGLDLPPKALSLNGSLAMAFGARGRGGKNAAMAHYEPFRTVINLTKRKGAGNLAHEWFHAFDDYYGTKFSKEFATNPYGGESDVDRNELMRTFKNFTTYLKEHTNLTSRSKEADRGRVKAYYGTSVEMSARAFESYVSYKLKDKGIRNDFLVNYRDVNAYQEERKIAYPYPLATELPAISEYFDRVFDLVEYKFENNNMMLYHSKDGKLLGYEQNGEVYLNKNELNPNTSVHEFSHIYLRALEQINPDLYKKGLSLIEEHGDQYVQEVKKNPLYSNLSSQQILEEALATAIGDRGQAFVSDESAMTFFELILQGLREFITNTFFYTQKENLDKLSLDKFLDLTAYDLLQGENLQLEQALDNLISTSANTEDEIQIDGNSINQDVNSVNEQGEYITKILSQSAIQVFFGEYSDKKPEVNFNLHDFQSINELNAFLDVTLLRYDGGDLHLAAKVPNLDMTFLLGEGAVQARKDFLTEVVNQIDPEFSEKVKKLQAFKAFCTILNEYQDKKANDSEYRHLFAIIVGYCKEENINFDEYFGLLNTATNNGMTKLNISDDLILISLPDVGTFDNEMGLIPFERKGDAYDIKVTREEAEQLFQNNVISEINVLINDKWEIISRHEMIPGTIRFDDSYKSFEIDTTDLVSSEIAKIINQLNEEGKRQEEFLEENPELAQLMSKSLAGDSEAQFQLALHLSIEDISEHDTIKWFKIAADNGHVDGMLFYGKSQLEREHVLDAIEYLKKAKEQDSPEAIWELAELYANGTRYIDVDYNQALENYQYLLDNYERFNLSQKTIQERINDLNKNTMANQFVTSEELQEIIPEDRKGDVFHVKVSKAEAEYLIKNDIVPDVMNAEYGQDEDWVGMTKDDFIEGVNVFDEDYKTFEINLFEQTKTNAQAIIHEIQKYEQLPDFQIEILEQTALLTNVKANTFEEAKEIAIERYNNELPQESQFSKEPGEIIARERIQRGGVSLNIPLQSHLSDAMIEIGFNPEQAIQRLRFVKELLNTYDDLNQRISRDTLDEIWSNLYPTQKENVIAEIEFRESGETIQYTNELEFLSAIQKDVESNNRNINYKIFSNDEELENDVKSIITNEMENNLSWFDRNITPRTKAYKDFVKAMENTSSEQFFQDGERSFNVTEQKYIEIYNFKNGVQVDMNPSPYVILENDKPHYFQNIEEVSKHIQTLSFSKSQTYLYQDRQNNIEVSINNEISRIELLSQFNLKDTEQSLEHANRQESADASDLIANLEKNENKVELFEDISKLPLELQETILEYNEKFENGDPYELSHELLSITESYGYTFEYGLDGIPINLEPMKFFDYEYDRQTRWEEDQILLQEQEILKDLAMPSETLDFHFFRRDGKTGEQVGGTLTYRDSNFDEIKSHMTTMGDYLGADEYFEMNIHINKRNIQPLVYKHTFYDFEIDSALEEISKIVSIKSKNPQDVRIFGGKIRDIANEAVVNPTSLHKYPENIKNIINQYIYQETKDFPVDLKKVESVVFMMLDQDKGINDLIEPYSKLNSSEIKFLESKANPLIQDEIENLNEAAHTPKQREKLAKEVNQVLTELAKLKAMNSKIQDLADKVIIHFEEVKSMGLNKDHLIQNILPPAIELATMGRYKIQPIMSYIALYNNPPYEPDRADFYDDSYDRGQGFYDKAKELYDSEVIEYNETIAKLTTTLDDFNIDRSKLPTLDSDFESQFFSDLVGTLSNLFDKEINDIHLSNLVKPQPYHDFELSDLTKRELQLQGSIRLADKIHQDEFKAAISLNDDETATITWASGEEEIYPFNAVFGKDWNYDLYHNNVLNNKNQKRMENSTQKQEFEVGRLASFTSEDGTFKKGKIETISDDSITIKDLNGNLATTSKDKLYQFFPGQKYDKSEIQSIFEAKIGADKFKELQHEDLIKLMRGSLTKNTFEVTSQKEEYQGQKFTLKYSTNYNSDKKELEILPHFKKERELSTAKVYGVELTADELTKLNAGDKVILSRTNKENKEYYPKVFLDKDLNDVFLDKFASQEDYKKSLEVPEAKPSTKKEFANRAEYEAYVADNVNIFENAKKINMMQLDKVLLSDDYNIVESVLQESGIAGDIIGKLANFTDRLDANNEALVELKKGIISSVNEKESNVQGFKTSFTNMLDNENKLSNKL